MADRITVNCKNLFTHEVIQKRYTPNPANDLRKNCIAALQNYCAEMQLTSEFIVLKANARMFHFIEIVKAQTVQCGQMPIETLAKSNFIAGTGFGEKGFAKLASNSQTLLPFKIDIHMLEGMLDYKTHLPYDCYPVAEQEQWYVEAEQYPCS